jgi:hypothetical protein
MKKNDDAPTYNMLNLKHASPGYGNEVQVCVESDSQLGLDQGIQDYMESYHPAGYGTRVSSRYKCVSGHRAVITRLASCD